MSEEWKTIPFEKSIEKVKYTSKIASSEYLKEGTYPIVSQEEGLISGYWNNSDDVFRLSKPVVIFGDHTRTLKYVDFDFVLGADGVRILQPIEQIDTKFLLYYLQSCKIPSLGYSRHYKLLKDLNVPIPFLAEQKHIVAELDCLSDIIEKQKQQLKELDNLAQSIFYTTFGDPISNNFGWNVKKLGDVCTIERGGSPRPITDYITDAEDGVNWIKIGDASEGSMYINSVKEKIKPEGVKKSRKVYKGDFILSNSMSFGKPYILGVDGCIHDGWLVIRDNNNVFNKCYLYYYLSSDALYGEFKSLAVGGVVNNLNSNLVRGVKVCIPDMSLQHEFASKIEAIEKQKETIKQSIAETETLFNSRMDYYFN